MKRYVSISFLMIENMRSAKNVMTCDVMIVFHTRSAQLQNRKVLKFRLCRQKIEI